MTQLRRFPPLDQDSQVVGVEELGDTEQDGDELEDLDEPGGLLGELERRQDDVLQRLDELNARIEAVLVGLGVKLDEAVGMR